MNKKPKKHCNGKPFVKGDPRAGRPKGTPNKVTVIGREFALGVLNSPEYREWLEERVRDKCLPPQIETLLWHYAVGKPKETVEHGFPDGVPVSVVEWVVKRVQAPD